MQFKIEEMPAGVKPYKVLPWDHIKNIKSFPVPFVKGTQEGYRKIGWHMVATCLTDDGVGLAAPQVGIMRQAILMREFVKNDDDETLTYLPSFRLYLNPSWTGIPEQGKSTLKEWCLSVPGKGYPIERFQEIEAAWFDFEGEEVVERKGHFEHFPARVFQHEYDHLKGISIPQRWKMQNTKKKPKSKKKRKRKK